MSFDLTTGAGTFRVIDPEYALVADVPSSTTGWYCTDVDQLLFAAPKRGTAPDIVPNADGVVPNPLYDDGFEVTLTYEVANDYDHAGDLIVPRKSARRRNLLTLREFYGPVPASPDSTVPLSFVLDDGEYEGVGQVLDFRWGPTAALLRLFLPDPMTLVP